jgi:hypothetical protein
MRRIGLAVVLAVPRIGLLVIDTCALPLARAKARECEKRPGCSLALN